MVPLSSVPKCRQWDVMEGDDSVACFSGRNLFCPGRYRGINWDPLCLEGTSVHLSINVRLKVSEIVNLVDLRKFLSHTSCHTHTHFNFCPPFNFTAEPKCKVTSNMDNAKEY